MAPMADVTDVAFRALVAARGAPDVFWTEFISADGLYHTRPVRDKTSEMSDLLSAGVSNGTSEIQRSEGHEALLRNLAFGENQRPIVAQIFSSKPEMIAYAARLVAELGFDGVDINMGCPDRTIEKQGAGAALVKNPALAVELIRAAREASELPVSVKTRIGYNKESLDEWLTALLLAGPAAITLHLRTRKEMSLVPADWELMKKRWKFAITSIPTCFLSATAMHKILQDAKIKIAESGCDGVMRLAARCSATPGYLRGIEVLGSWTSAARRENSRRSSSSLTASRKFRRQSILLF